MINVFNSGFLSNSGQDRLSNKKSEKGVMFCLSRNIHYQLSCTKPGSKYLWTTIPIVRSLSFMSFIPPKLDDVCENIMRTAMRPNKRKRMKVSPSDWKNVECLRESYKKEFVVQYCQMYNKFMKTLKHIPFQTSKWSDLRVLYLKVYEYFRREPSIDDMEKIYTMIQKSQRKLDVFVSFIKVKQAHILSEINDVFSDACKIKA